MVKWTKVLENFCRSPRNACGMESMSTRKLSNLHLHSWTSHWSKRKLLSEIAFEQCFWPTMQPHSPQNRSCFMQEGPKKHGGRGLWPDLRQTNATPQVNKPMTHGVADFVTWEQKYQTTKYTVHFELRTAVSFLKESARKWGPHFYVVLAAFFFKYFLLFVLMLFVFLGFICLHYPVLCIFLNWYIRFGHR